MSAQAIRKALLAALENHCGHPLPAPPDTGMDEAGEHCRRCVEQTHKLWRDMEPVVGETIARLEQAVTQMARENRSLEKRIVERDAELARVARVVEP